MAFNHSVHDNNCWLKNANALKGGAPSRDWHFYTKNAQAFQPPQIPGYTLRPNFDHGGNDIRNVKGTYQ